MISIREFERRAIDAVAAVSPWLVPAIPAYMTAHHAARYLVQGTGWIDTAFVVVTALAVETVGLSAVHTAVEFWSYNDARKASAAAAPVWLAMGAGAFYVCLVLTVNAVLDWTQAPGAVILAKAMLSLLSVDAGLIVAMRAQHARRLAEADEARETARQERREARDARLKAAETVETPILRLETGDKAAAIARIMAETGVSRATAYRRYNATVETVRDAN